MLKNSFLLVLILLSLFCFSTFAQEDSPLFLISVDGKKGFIDKTGKVVIKPQFEEAEDFSDGLAAVKVGERWGFIDKTGAVVIEPQFGTESYFSEGFAPVILNDSYHPDRNKWALVGKNGNVIGLPQIKDARGRFSQGLLAVKNSRNEWGYIDTNGNVVIPFKFKRALAFSEDLACVMLEDKYGFINRKGEIVIAPQFTKCMDFGEGLASVKFGGQLATEEPQAIDEDEFKLSRWAFIDKGGNIAARLRDDVTWAGKFSEGLALVQIKKKEKGFSVGFVDKFGKFVIKPNLYEAADFSEGLALAFLTDEVEKPAFINKSGKLVYSAKNATLGSFRNGLARIQEGYSGIWVFDKSHKYGYIDKKGKVIWKPTK